MIKPWCDLIMISTTPNSSRASQSDDKVKRIRAINFRSFISLINILMVGYFFTCRVLASAELYFFVFSFR